MGKLLIFLDLLTQNSIRRVAFCDLSPPWSRNLNAAAGILQYPTEPHSRTKGLLLG